MNFKIIDYKKLRQEAKVLPEPSIPLKHTAFILYTYKPARNKSDVLQKTNERI